MKYFNKKSFSEFFLLGHPTNEETQVEETVNESVVKPKIDKTQDTKKSKQRAEKNRSGNQMKQTNTAMNVSSPNPVPSNKKVVAMNTYQQPVQPTSNVNANCRMTDNQRVDKKVSVFEPSEYGECRMIAQSLFKNEIVILSFAAMEEFQARRVVDFLTGAVYAIDGDIRRIGEEIFICTPKNVEISSTIAKSLIEAHFAEM